MSCNLVSLPWEIIYKAKTFICACLNAAITGIIYFGVGDCPYYQHGEIIGLQVENVKDDIIKTFQCVLDYHIKSNRGPLSKGGDQNNCVRIYFVPVKIKEKCSKLYVVEIEVERDFRFCKDNIYRSRIWTPRKGVRNKESKQLRTFFNVMKEAEWDDVFIRTNAVSDRVMESDVQYHVGKPLQEKYEEWKQNAQPGKCILWLFTSFSTMPYL